MVCFASASLGPIFLQPAQVPPAGVARALISEGDRRSLLRDDVDLLEPAFGAWVEDPGAEDLCVDLKTLNHRGSNGRPKLPGAARVPRGQVISGIGPEKHLGGHVSEKASGQGQVAQLVLVGQVVAGRTRSRWGSSRNRSSSHMPLRWSRRKRYSSHSMSVLREVWLPAHGDGGESSPLWPALA